MRSSLNLAIVSALLLAAGAADARPAKKTALRVAIGSFEGASGPELQAVVSALVGGTKGWELVSAESWREAAGRLGLDPASPESVTRVAVELQVAALLNGSLAPVGKSWPAVVVAVSGQSGQAVGRLEVKQKTKAKALAAVKRGFGKKLGRVIGAQRAPAPPPPEEQASEPAPSPSVETPSAPPGPRKRVVVLGFEGDRTGELRDFLEKELAQSRELELVSRADLERIRKELSLDLEEEEDRAKAAGRLELSAFIQGSVEREDREIRVRFEVFAGVDGESVGKGESGSTKMSAVARVLRRDLAPFLERARAPGDTLGESPAGSRSTVGAAPSPPSTESAPVSRAETARAPERDTSSRLRSESPLELAVGFQWGLRDHDYADDLFGALRAYQHTGVTSLAARLLWYPGAHFSRGLAAHLGVDAELNLGLGLSTETQDGQSEFATSALSLAASLRGRIPLGRHELGLFAGIAIDRFALDDAEALFPNVAYTSLRPGVTGRFWLGDRVSLSPHFAWRVVLDAGAITGADWFPRASVGGLDAGLVVGVGVVGPLELQLAGTYRRYFFTMNPEVGDPWIAGGALDQRVTATFYLAVYLD